MIGQRFGRWTVIEAQPKQKHARWLCKCDCGSVSAVTQSGLLTGTSKSCGCLHKELVSRKHRKHGASESRTYQIWEGMKQRTTNPNSPSYFRYGGRGIDLCEEWHKYDGFLADMGEAPDGLKLERLDNNSGYRKDNCIWATQKQQMNNTSVTVQLTIDGVTHSLSDWSMKSGIDKRTIYGRLKRGYDAKTSVFSPLKRGRKL